MCPHGLIVVYYCPQVMFLGVVANPIPEKKFNGKIFVERIAREQAYKKRDHNQNFTDDATANGLLKDGRQPLSKF